MTSLPNPAAFRIADPANREAQHTRSDARNRERMLMLRAVWISYCIDSVLLWLLHLAGAVRPEAALFDAAGGLLLCSLAYFFYKSGWVDRRRDPYLAGFQILGATGLQLFIAWRAPEAALMMLMIVFIVFAFAALRLDFIRLLLVWTVCSAGMAAVVSGLGGNLSLPHATPWQVALSSLWMSLVLGRCAFVGLYGATVRKKLSVRNRQLADAKDRLYDMATRDGLTGALNRTAIIDLLDEAIASGDNPAAVLVDLDYFKNINDRHGHLVGDAVLRRFVTAAANALRTTDRLGRYGGEEFLLVIAGSPTEQTALAVAERAREAVADAPWATIAPELEVTASLGVACARPGESAEDLLRRADSALYAAKDGGRNTTRIR